MSQENEPAERVQPEQTQQPTQSTEDAVRRLTDAHPPQPGPTPPEPEPKDEPECEPTAETESTP
jgi:hypothetical protein